MPLADLTTMHVGGPAARLVTVTTTDELVDAIREVDDADEALLVLGGGSNLVVAQEGFAGTVVHVATTGVAVESDDSSLIFANLEDFDMLFGHRNNPQGMAQALESWDVGLGSLLPKLRPTDLLLLTADHGNDPTTASTDHSREYPFLLAYGPGLRSNVDLGIRQTYADIAATLREVFALLPGRAGTSFLSALRRQSTPPCLGAGAGG